MSKTEQVEISKLHLDLNNFRTTPQKTEQDAIKAMITIKPERFFAVMESIIDDGYLHTENIIVLEDNGKLIVKEGNRRIGTLKLIHGLYHLDDYLIPDSIKLKIESIDSIWKKENSIVPCSIFDFSDSIKVDKIISLTHGKGEKASRFPWTSVATARHNRDINKASEPALDLLEKYIINGQNINNQQKERWAGDYPLTVLLEAVNRIITRFDVKNSAELAKNYPKIKYKSELEDLMRDIGLEIIGFPKIRATDDFALAYGINPIVIQIPPTNSITDSNTNSTSSQSTDKTNFVNSALNANNHNISHTPLTTGISTGPNIQTTPITPTTSPAPPKAVATNNPKYVATLLKKFTPKGSDRHKVVTLRDEMKQLNIEKNPIAFCFLLRSMFEISAKAFASENSISVKKPNGTDKYLVEILKEITSNLTTNNSNQAKNKVLHGAITELGRTEGILSVTSMNQLVHNPSFTVSSTDICTLFGNVFPLLEEMN